MSSPAAPVSAFCWEKSTRPENTNPSRLAAADVQASGARIFRYHLSKSHCGYDLMLQGGSRLVRAAGIVSSSHQSLLVLPPLPLCLPYPPRINGEHGTSAIALILSVLLC